MKVRDGIRAWSIILYQGKPYIVLNFTCLANRDMRVDFVKIAEWDYSIDVQHILNLDFDDLKQVQERYSSIEECEVLLSW